MQRATVFPMRRGNMTVRRCAIWWTAPWNSGWHRGDTRRSLSGNCQSTWGWSSARWSTPVPRQTWTPLWRWLRRCSGLKRVLDKHMKINSPYNTYQNPGLPPGPVRMPSIQVVDAVLNYQHHDYMFFCAKSDFSGRHHFSRTLREHNRHAIEYHKALNKRKIYWPTLPCPLISCPNF